MPLEVSWRDIAIRLLLTIVAGTLIGLNREERGQAAGLRTTLLVCLAASVSMIQVNLLLDVAGKAHDSFVVMDLMRLPLGILSGMGFIGGGVILRKGSIVRGVTTAATLWFVTVMGLCFGGGQIGLGLGALALGLIVLIGLKQLEKHLKQNRQATLTLVAGQKAPSEEEIITAIAAAGYKIVSSSIIMGENAVLTEMSCEVSWRTHHDESDRPVAFLKEMGIRFGLAKVDWRVGEKSTQ
ncbi:MAG TPA: MgtC/SapB family protein [Verrucomicrobiae bacterium]|jgi:putative Mg2+ transporter-C (MgtC) family protein|nr:MgtC/SapB family protein [Verrucomicrobiae bacterium]